MKVFLTFLFFSVFQFAYSQQKVKIIDKTTRQTIPGVNIYSKNPLITATTNAKGEADISVFKHADTIFISCIGYKKITLFYKDLKEKKFIIELTESEISLDELVVSASRWEEKDKEIPYRIEKVSLRDIQFQNPQTSADLLGNSGYAYIQKSQQAGGSPMLRGFATNRVLLVVDGVRMNNAIFRSGNVQNVISIDANAIRETEILFGPGAVMYGSDAIGGVMDFHTLRPMVSDSGKVFFTGTAFSRYSSANFEKTGHLDFSVGTKKVGWVTSFSYCDFDDLITGKKGNSYFLRPIYQTVLNGNDTTLINDHPQKQIHSDYAQTNFMQKVLFKPDSIHELEYGFYYASSSDAPRYDRLTVDQNNDGKLDHAEWYYGPQKWMMHRLSWKLNAPKKIMDHMRLIASYQRFDESRHNRKTGSSLRKNQNETVHVFSAYMDFDKKVNEKWMLFYGAEWVENHVRSEANEENITTDEISAIASRYPDSAIWQSYAVYGNTKIKITPRFILNGGARFSYISMHTKFDTAFFPFPFTESANTFKSVNGSAGMVFNATDDWNIYSNFSTGFRAPNIDDIGKIFESEPGSLVVPNVQLKPEYAYSAEAGTSKKFGNYLKLDVTIYYTYLKDALARRDFVFNGEDSVFFDGQLSRVQAIRNISHAKIAGVQAGADIYFGKGFGLRSVINFQNGKEYSADSASYFPLSHAAPVFGSTHVTYVRQKMKIDFYANYNGKMDFEDLSLNDRTDDLPFAKDENGKPFVPSWFTLNLKAAFYATQHVSFTAGIENITNVLYRPFSSGISAPGRNFVVTLRGNF